MDVIGNILRKKLNKDLFSFNRKNLEEIQRKREYAKQRYANLSTEERQRIIGRAKEHQKEYRKNMTEEQRIIFNYQNRQAQRKRRETPEYLEQQRIYMNKRNKKLRELNVT